MQTFPVGLLSSQSCLRIFRKEFHSATRHHMWQTSSDPAADHSPPDTDENTRGNSPVNSGVICWDKED